MESKPTKPRIEGSPTDMVLFERDGNKILFVASGRLHWYAKPVAGGGNPGWDLSDYRIPQPAGDNERVIGLAATDNYLYALVHSDSDSGMKFTLKRLGKTDGSWETISIGNRKIQTIFAAGGKLFASSLESGYSYNILYLDDNEDSLDSLPMDGINNVQMLTGIAVNGDTYYLSTAGSYPGDSSGDRDGSGIIAVDFSGSSPDVKQYYSDLMFSGIIRIPVRGNRLWGTWNIPADPSVKLIFSGENDWTRTNNGDNHTKGTFVYSDADKLILKATHYWTGATEDAGVWRPVNTAAVKYNAQGDTLTFSKDPLEMEEMWEIFEPIIGGTWTKTSSTSSVVIWTFQTDSSVEMKLDSGDNTWTRTENGVEYAKGTFTNDETNYLFTVTDNWEDITTAVTVSQLESDDFRNGKLVLDAAPDILQIFEPVAGTWIRYPFILAVDRNGNLYKLDDGGGGFTGLPANLGSRKSGGTLAAWGDTYEPKLLLASIASTTSTYICGYVEFLLNGDGTLSSWREPGRNKPSSVGDYERYNSSIGTHPVKHLFQAPPEIDNKMTLFASTQTAGLWSYRFRGDQDEWNREE